jgi:short-subunit dehydrogenase
MRENEMKCLSVVITGASSGIGKATAIEFANHQASMILCSRSEANLQTTARECENRGARVIIYPLDMTDELRLKAVADRAVQEFGKLDVWVNDAAVGLFGRLEDLPSETVRRIVEVNFLGYVYGCRAAIPHMRRQGKGIIINVSSLASIAGLPYQSLYASTSSAINTLGSCLRMETIDKPRIKICTLVLPSIDTPMLQHAGNYTGRAVRAFPPVYTARRAARTIIRMVARPRKQVILGVPAKIVVAIKRLMPFLTEKRIAVMAEKGHFKMQSSPHTPGNLFQPMSHEEMISGGWLKRQPAMATR